MRSLPFFSFALLTGGLLLPSLASGQSSTPILGFYKFTAPAGNSLWTAGLITKTDFQSKATSVTSGTPNSTITQAAPAWTPGTVFNRHYVEILDDPATPAVEPWTGLIMDIVSNTDTTVSVSETFSAFVGLGSTPLYAIRKHATLGTLFVNGAGMNAFGDIVTLYLSNGTISTHVYDGGGGFIDGGGNPSTNQIIYPGQGFQLTTTAPTEITIGGGEVAYVKSTPTKIPVYLGIINLMGPVTPLVATNPADPLFPSTIPMSQTGILGSNLEPFGEFLGTFGTAGLLTSTGTFTPDGGGGVLDGGGGNGSNFPVMRGTSFTVTVNTEKYFTAPVVHPIN